jgi:COMPASS component SWD2
LSLCPADDTFLSSSLDRTVRFWNLQQAGCLAECKLSNEVATATTDPVVVAVFDHTGLVFGVAATMANQAGYYLHLYDARNYGAGAFCEFKLSHQDLMTQPSDSIRSLQFNASGNCILLNTTRQSILLDGFEGTVQHVLQDGSGGSACFTPDDRTVLQSNESYITCWDTATGSVVNRLQGHVGPIRCVAANPVRQQIASSCSQTALWSW